MDTKAIAQKLGNLFLAAVRGPFFLAALSMALLVAVVPIIIMMIDPAQATLLKGYVQNDDEPSASAAALSPSSIQGEPETPTQAPFSKVANAARRAALAAGSYPSTY